MYNNSGNEHSVWFKKKTPHSSTIAIFITNEGQLEMFNLHYIHAVRCFKKKEGAVLTLGKIDGDMSHLQMMLMEPMFIC